MRKNTVRDLWKGEHVFTAEIESWCSYYGNQCGGSSKITWCRFTLGNFPKALSSYYRGTFASRFLVLAFILARDWKQPKCPLREDWIMKMWYIRQWNIFLMPLFLTTKYQAHPSDHLEKPRVRQVAALLWWQVQPPQLLVRDNRLVMSLPRVPDARGTCLQSVSRGSWIKGWGGVCRCVILILILEIHPHTPKNVRNNVNIHSFTFAGSRENNSVFWPHYHPWSLLKPGLNLRQQQIRWKKERRLRV